MPRFEWDPRKRASNQEKHGLNFEDAHHVFEDPNRTEYDSHRGGESRWRTVGRVFGLLLTVVYTIRRAAIRVISFRHASQRERNDYLDQQKETPHEE